MTKIITLPPRVFERLGEKMDKVKGVARTLDQTLVVEYETDQGNRSVFLVKEDPGGGLTVVTKNKAIEEGLASWHLAAAGVLAESILKTPPLKPLDTVTVVVKSPSVTEHERRGGQWEDFSLRVLGRRDWKMVPEGIFSASRVAAEAPARQDLNPDAEGENLPGDDPRDRYLWGEGVATRLVAAVAQFRNQHPVPDAFLPRVPTEGRFLGGAALRMAVAALLSGRHLLVLGEKGTGKDRLAQALAWVLNRPLFGVEGHAYVEPSHLTGDRTLRSTAAGPEVVFEPEALCLAMESGGLLSVSEFNMIRPEVASVLNAAGDHRRAVEVPGYGKVAAHPAFRMILTMNHGYAGTVEPNEATVDRAVVLRLNMDLQILGRVLAQETDAPKEQVDLLVRVFKDLSEKARHGEISSRAVTVRGLIDALELHAWGIPLKDAVLACVANKAFDEDERERIVRALETLGWLG